jgi:uncharacterized repeat protein (TIGR01451 family)
MAAMLLKTRPPGRSTPRRISQPHVENLENRRLLAFDQGPVLVETFDDVTLTSAQLIAPQGWDDTKSIPAPAGSNLPPTPTGQPLFHHTLTSLGGRLDGDLVAGEGTTTVSGLPRQALHLISPGSTPESTGFEQDDVTFPVIDPGIESVHIAEVDALRVGGSAVVVSFQGTGGTENVVDRLPTGANAPVPSVLGGPATPGGGSPIITGIPPNAVNWDTLVATSSDVLPNGNTLGAILRISLIAPSGREFDNLRIFVGNPIVVGPLIAAADSAQTPPGHPVDISVLSNDSEPNGGPLSIQSVSNGATINGTFTPSTGSATIQGQDLIYTPTANFHGLDRVSYVVADTHGNTATATVTIAVDRPPEAGDHAYSLPHGATGSLSVPAPGFPGLLHFATDAENDTLSVQPVVGQPTAQGGSVTIRSDGSFDYTPPAGSFPSLTNLDSFSYTVSDGLVDGIPGTIHIGGENTPPPNAIDETVPVAHGHFGPVTFAAPGIFADNPRTDADGDTLRPVVVTQPSSGRVTFNPDGSFNYTPTDPSRPVLDSSFTYALADAYGPGSQATVHLTVPNSAPTAHDVSIEIPHNQIFGPVTLGDLLLAAGVMDPDGDSIHFQAVAQPAYGSVDRNPGFTYNPRERPADQADNGLMHDSFSFDVADDYSAATTVRVNLTFDDFAPVAPNQQFFTLFGIAPPGQPLRVSGNVIHTTPWDRLAPPSYLANFQAHPQPKDNAKPLDPDNIPEARSAHDRISHAVLVDPPTKGRVIALLDNGDFTYESDPGQPLFGEDSFSYTVSDGFAVSKKGYVTITEGFAGPIIRSDSYTTSSNTPLAAVGLNKQAFLNGNPINVESQDVPLSIDAFPNGTPLTPYSSSVKVRFNPKHGYLVSVFGRVDSTADGPLNNDGGFVYIPDDGFVGTDSFTYFVNYGLNPDPDRPLATYDASDFRTTVLIDVTATAQATRQDNVVSLPDATDGRNVTLVSPSGTKLLRVQASLNPSPVDTPPGVDFTYGFFSFTITGLPSNANTQFAPATTLTLFLPDPVTPGFVYYKYGKEPTNSTPHWYAFTYDSSDHNLDTFGTGAETFLQNPQLAPNEVVLHFRDGARGDDAPFDGIIVDPGGPAFPAADLALSQVAMPAAPIVGQDLTLTLTVTNRGSTAAFGVVVTDPLPAGVAFVSAASSQGSAMLVNGSVLCRVGTLAPGASATIRLVGRPAAPGVLTNTARVSGNQVDPSASAVVATTTVTVLTANPWQQFVTTSYSEILGRFPEPRGLAFWVSRLKAGAPRRRVARAIFMSPEHRGLARQHLAPHFTLRRAFLDALHADRSAASRR